MTASGKHPFGPAINAGPKSRPMSSMNPGRTLHDPSSFWDTASSLRYSGAPDGYQYDTINFYEGHYYMGDEHFYYDDAPSFTKDNMGE